MTSESALIGLIGAMGIALAVWLLDRHVTAHWLDED